MDAVLSAVVTKLPELGIAGIALVLLFAAWRNAAADRADYRDALKAAEERHSAELIRVNREHDAEAAELRASLATLRGDSDARITALTKRLDDLNAALDLEIEARRKAQDEAAEALRRSGGLS